MTDLKRKETKDPNAQWVPWDFSYYGSLYKKKKYSIDEDIVKEYFPAENVKAKTLEIYQELLSLEFKLLPHAQTWQELVTCYEVKDKESQKVLGHFYLDLYPRPDKFNHAAAFTLLKRAKIGDEIKLAAAAMVTNFNPAAGGKPSLLMHHEVVTFFHEFGHVMHNLCSEANFSRFSGASVERDFVEMPSQMLENWIWDKEILKRVSKHYQTGQPLPEKMIDQKIESQKGMVATATLNQIFLGSVDLLLYSASDKKMLAAADQSKGDGLAEWRRQIKHKSGFQVDTEELWHFLSSRIQQEELQ